MHASAMRPLPNEPATYALPSIAGGLTAREVTRAVHTLDGARKEFEEDERCPASERLLSTSITALSYEQGMCSGSLDRQNPVETKCRHCNRESVKNQSHRYTSHFWVTPHLLSLELLGPSRLAARVEVAWMVSCAGGVTGRGREGSIPVVHAHGPRAQR